MGSGDGRGGRNIRESTPYDAPELEMIRAGGNGMERQRSKGNLEAVENKAIGRTARTARATAARWQSRAESITGGTGSRADNITISTNAGEEEASSGSAEGGRESAIVPTTTRPGQIGDGETEDSFQTAREEATENELSAEAEVSGEVNHEGTTNVTSIDEISTTREAP